MSASAAAHAGIPSAPSQASNWVRQGLESFVAAQKILLDLTAQQNALAIGIVRERVKMPSLNVGPALVKIAGHVVEDVTGAGKILLDLAAGETAIVVDGLKDMMRLGPVAGPVVDIIRYRAETLIEMQRKLLDAVAQQMETIVASYEEGKGLMASASAVALARRTVETFVQTEKHFLNLVAEEVNAAAEGEKVARKVVRDRSKLLAGLARQAVDKYIDAQKELAELAIRRVEAGRRAVKESVEEQHADDEKRTSMAEWTQKSVKNLISAEKQLLELAIKPVKAAAAEGQRPPRKRKKAAAAGPSA